MRRQQRGKRQPGPHLKQACNQADIYIPCTAQHVQITVHYRGNNIGKPHYTEKIRPLCNAGSIGGWVKENRQQQPARCKHRDGQHQANHAKRFQRITQALAHAVYIVFSHILPRVNGQCIAYRYHNLNRQRIDPLHSGVSRHGHTAKTVYNSLHGHTAKSYHAALQRRRQAKTQNQGGIHFVKTEPYQGKGKGLFLPP